MQKNNKKFSKKSTRKALLTFFVFIVILFVSGLFLKYRESLISEGLENNQRATNPNRVFTLEELKKYNGSDPNRPIYIGYEGKVYDVTSGRNFYGAGQTYNYLTGRDATAELNEVGVGEIIVRKYPVVGRLE